MSIDPEGYSVPLIDVSREEAAENATHLSARIEEFAVSTRQLESELQKERFHSKQLRVQLGKTTNQYQALRRNEEQLRHRVSDFEARDRSLTAQIRNLSLEFEKCRRELNGHRKNWALMQAKEKQLQAAISERDCERNRAEHLQGELRGLEDRFMEEAANREQAERHAANYQNELQSILVRLHASEAKFSDLTKELEAMNELRKNHQAEVDRARESAAEEAAQKAEAQFFALDRRYNDELSRIKSEITRCLTEEKDRATDALQQIIEEREKRISKLADEQNKYEKTERELRARISNIEAARLESESKIKNATLKQEELQKTLAIAQKTALDLKRKLEHKEALLLAYSNELGEMHGMLSTLGISTIQTEKATPLERALPKFLISTSESEMDC